MFDGCEKLNYIKMLAIDISATDCLLEWVHNVEQEGIFIKHPDSPIRKTNVLDADGIPYYWTVETATE
jgi:hypothetical protein